MYKKKLFSLLLALTATQSVLATDWSIVRSGGLSYVNYNQKISTALYFYAKSGETLSLNHFGGPTTLFCAYSSIDNPGKFLGDKVVSSGESMTLRLPSTNLYITACAQVSGTPGDNALGVLKTSSLGKKIKTDTTSSNFELSETERDILLEELHEYVDRNAK